MDADTSEDSLDVYIPSYPGSPRSFSLNEPDDINSSNSSVQRFIEAGSIEQRADTSSQGDDDILLQDEKKILAAAEVGNTAAIMRLIKQGVDLNQMDNLGRNALHFAVQRGDLTAIELLLKAGIDATIKDKVGMTPLMLCLMRSPSVKAVELLFQYGVVILPRSSKMDTGIFLQFVMMCTPTHEDAKILKMLVDKGALIDDPGAPGRRQALHFAAMSNNCDLIKILIDLGANPYAKNHRNETPLQVAEIFQCKQAVALLTSIESESIYSVSSKLALDTPEQTEGSKNKLTFAIKKIIRYKN